MQLIYCINIKEELEIFKGFPLVMRKKYRSLSDGTAFSNVLTDPMYVCMYVCIYVFIVGVCYLNSPMVS